jgi:hypothetical protein
VKLKHLSLALLLTLIACGGKETSPGGQKPAIESASTSSPYKLQIVFRGLIAFAEDSGNVRVFLVNAEYDPPSSGSLPPDKSLPPGVVDEIKAGISDLHDYPPHLPRIRLQNAEVLSGPVPDSKLGFPIAGADLTFKTSSTSSPVLKLSELSNADKIFAARPELKAGEEQRLKIAKLDLLDLSLLNSPLDPRLSARAVIESGTVTAGPVPCPGGRKGFSFKTAEKPPLGLTCPGKVEDAVNLAEEVRVEQANVTVPTVIDFGPSKKQSITIKPRDASSAVVIEVLNQTQEALEGDQCKEERHPPVFRWFYRLLSADSQGDIGNHLFPCVKRDDKGDPKCPQKLMFIKKDDRR